MPDSGQERETPSFGELFGQLARDLGLLLQQEVALAKKEFQQALGQAALGAIILLVAGVLATVGLVLLLSAVVLALALVLPHWAAALLVGLVFLVLAGLGAWLGIRRLAKLRLIPERTLRTLKEDAAMFREKVG